jgi:uncharacterized RDD family membrane protein YckC
VSDACTVTAPPPVRAGLLRRLGAMLYDGLLLLAVLMVATAVFLPLTGGEAVDPGRNPVLELVYQSVLLLLIVGFFGLFWTRRGQTLGMASWHLRVEREDGALLGWGDTLRRLGWALVSLLALGLGFLWIVFDPERRAWHDRLSRTRVVVLPKGSPAR